MDYDNKNFWESIDRKRSRELPEPNPFTAGEVAALVTAAVCLTGIVVASYFGWL